MGLSSIVPLALASQSAIILAFALIGAGLKYIDDAFDEGIFSKRIAMLIAPILVVIWVCLSISDSISATLLFSILFAVLLTGKVDNLVFKMCSITLISMLALTRMLHLLWIPLFILITMGVVDEKGDDYVENNEALKWGKFFFSHRCCMKTGVLGLCIFSLLPWLYLFAFLALDLSYDLVGAYDKLSVENRREKKLALLNLTNVDE
jgi:hypothetical protein